MPTVLPNATRLFGRRTVFVVKAIASATNAPTVDELTNPANAIRVECNLYEQGGMVTGEQGTVTAPQRVCETAQRNALGSVTLNVSSFLYSFDAQAGPTDPANAAKTFLEPNEDFYIVDRIGKPNDAAPLAGDRVSVAHITAGVQNREPVGDGEAAELGIRQVLALAADGFYNDDLVVLA